MTLGRALFAVFLLVPLLEIFLLIEVGGWIGVGWTVFLVVFTAVLGAHLVRRQGLSTLRRVQASLERRELPAAELLEGLFLLVAGALLLTPGFFTDAVGFACLTPPLRAWVTQELLRRGVLGVGPRGPGAAGGRTFDAEYRHLDD